MAIQGRISNRRMSGVGWSANSTRLAVHREMTCCRCAGLQLQSIWGVIVDTKRVLLGGLLALFSVVALAAGPGAVRKQAEASMLVTGDVLIQPDGTVSGWDLDQRDKLPAAVVGLVEKSASTWRFEPVMVDGVARKARARMSLRVVAERVEGDDESYRITIQGSHFGGEAEDAGEQEALASTDRLYRIKMGPPRFPEAAFHAGATGTVYLVLRIDRSGAVTDVIAEQVNLRVAGSEAQMKQLRKMFGQSAVAAARKWTFRPPTTGEGADDAFYSVRVPVDYRFQGDKVAGYGEWEAYIPGPRAEIPWREQAVDPNETPDALVAGGVYQDGDGLKLLTPLSGS